MPKRAGAALLITGGALALLLNFKTPQAVGAGPIGGSVGGSTGSAAGSTGSTSGSTASAASAAKSGIYTGSAVQTRYGAVQLQVTVAAGKITAIQALEYPSDNPRSSAINQSAIPALIQEALQAQSSQVNSVSGATYTSQGFMASLQAAISQANA